MITYQEFKNKWLGKAIDWDKNYGAQCVDVYRQYCNDIGFKQSPPVVGAKDIWNTYLKTDFDKVENTPTGVPPQGCVLIWGTVVGQYGHVAICDKATTKSFVSIDQNWPVDNGNGVLHEVTHNYNGLLGWLIPKSSIINDMTDEQKRILEFLAGKTEGNVREAFGALAEIPNLNKKIKDLETSQKDLVFRIEQLEADATANNKLISDYQSTITTAKETESKLQADIQVWKNRYEVALKDQVNKYTGWQLIRLGVNKIISSKKS